MITVTNPFSAVGSAVATQYLTVNNSITSNNSFQNADTRDSAGFDAATRNQFQVWVCDGAGNRSNTHGGNGRGLGFVINGF
ncbi:hypothetical protein [Chryseobacterium sp.]|uniref:hypothetical protein n=1 Tax=Chryseobacterium sp. TaxID=1871047 RepID=UPI0031D3A808